MRKKLCIYIHICSVCVRNNSVGVTLEDLPVKYSCTRTVTLLKPKPLVLPISILNVFSISVMLVQSVTPSMDKEIEGRWLLPLYRCYM